MCYVLLCATVIIVLLSYTTFIHLFFLQVCFTTNVAHQSRPLFSSSSKSPSPSRVCHGAPVQAATCPAHQFESKRRPPLFSSSSESPSLSTTASPSSPLFSSSSESPSLSKTATPSTPLCSFPLLARAQVPQQPPQSKQQLALRYSSPRSYSLPISLSPSGPPTLFFFSIAGAQVRHGAPDQATRSGSVPVHLLAHCRCFY
jgi:hypothetical protein